MLSLPLIAVFCVTLALIWWFRDDDKPGKKYKQIPGPIGLPGLGNVLQVGAKMHLKFFEWADKYGDIFQIKLGIQKAVVISDPKMIKEIFTVEPAFAGRSFFEGFDMYKNEVLGIVSTEGELWEVHRRFLLRQLRDFGFGKSSMEQLVMDEVKETIDRFEAAKDGKIYDIRQIFQVAVINSLWMIVASERFRHDDPKLVKMMKDSDKFTVELVSRAVFFLVPWTRYFLPGVEGLDELILSNRKFYEEATERHKATLDKDNPRDFIDIYLKEMDEQKNNPDSQFYGDRAERQLNVILSDLFFAGSDTTSNTLAWAVLYLTKFPQAQKKMQQEIDLVTGGTRPVSVSDRPNMPYTCATMEETFRYSSIVPSGVQHRAMAGKEFRGYFIDKDTWIFPNLWHLHHNPKTWGDPENFRPERFLSPDGTFKKSENVMAFQVGRRQCVGESLARDSFFLFMTNIFQRFSVSLDPAFPEPPLEAGVAFVLTPEKYHIVLKKRD